MAVSGDVSIGQSNVKLHPYLVTLVRWCLSSVWSTACLFLHRLLSSPLQPITGPKPAPARAKPPARAPGTEHLHPEPRVECQLLHQPETHTLDVIFVHGLYGSLGNTWRQGDWRQKYATDPRIVTLLDHSKPSTCKCNKNSFKNDDNKCKTNGLKQNTNNETQCVEANMTDLNDSELSISKINEKLSKKIIPQENDLITEQFYNNTLKDNDANYETQANFVTDMFRKEMNCDKCCENNKCDDIKCKTDVDDVIKCKDNQTDRYENDDDNCDQDKQSDSSKSDEENDDIKCKFKELNEFNECKCVNEKKCEVGCGCICNDCYSTCWPRDWVKEDFPGARVISINYTSDPYLWRPLWIKENKRLNLYQRAEQMIEQLLEMRVGEKPVIWVGHSKGGLFIKQIYCQAYEAYKKINKEVTSHDETEKTNDKNKKHEPKETNEMTAGNIDMIIEHFNHEKEMNVSSKCTNNSFINVSMNMNDLNANETRTNDSNKKNNISKETTHLDIPNHNTFTRNINIQNVMNNNSCVMNDIVKYENIFENLSANDNLEYTNVRNDSIRENHNKNESMNDSKIKYNDLENGDGNQDLTSSIEDEILSRRARLWSSSRGFMFYSVPHRGSPLADIKTPLTARSVDLLEIAKDCPLVLELQARWSRAVRAARAGRGAGRGAVRVRSAVETSRTLMSVLWLRIVSTHSADAGEGTLWGISVDHREICKPSSRACHLYTMLADLIREAVSCTCY